MAKSVRIAFSNLIQAAASVLVPSSEETSLPRAALTRQGLSDRWRTKIGWTIVAAVNNQLAVDVGGGAIAVAIAAGYYATGAALATAIQTALTTTFPAMTWTVSYNVAAADKFRISATGGVFQLILDDPTDAGASIMPDIGFDTTAPGGAGFTADTVSYQSRHWLNVDLATSQAFTAAILRGHNLSASGTATLQADAASLATVGLRDAVTPDVSQAIAGTNDPRVSFFTSQTKRYLRLIFSDVTNSTGYLELAVAFVGPYSQPTIVESNSFVERYEPLSEIAYAIGGAHSQVRRTRRRVWSLLWEHIEAANIDIFRTLDETVPMGGCFFLSLDAADNPLTSTVYGYLRAGVEVHLQVGTYSNVPLEFAEALQ